MPNFNQVTLLGRLVNDVESVSNGKIGKFTIVVNEKYKDTETSSFINCTLFDEKRTEVLTKYVKKGSHLLVTGKLRQEKWETDGQKRSALVVIVDNFQFIDPPTNADKAISATAKTKVSKENTVKEEDTPF